MDFQRKMLAELMAPLLPETQKKFTDRDVCKNYLVAFCPNELFTNTKADLGTCHLIHEQKLQVDYQASKDKGRLLFLLHDSEGNTAGKETFTTKYQD